MLCYHHQLGSFANCYEVFIFDQRDTNNVTKLIWPYKNQSLPRFRWFSLTHNYINKFSNKQSHKNMLQNIVNDYGVQFVTIDLQVR